MTRTVIRRDCLTPVSRIWFPGCTDCAQPVGDSHLETCPKVLPLPESRNR